MNRGLASLLFCLFYSLNFSGGVGNGDRILLLLGTGYKIEHVIVVETETPIIMQRKLVSFCFENLFGWGESCFIPSTPNN